MKKIGFIGLGNMGLPMAVNLVKAGYEVKGFDIIPRQLEQFAQAGGSGAASIEAAIQGAQVIISMLPSGAHVDNVYNGDEGILAALQGTPLLIDCSTIDPATAKAVAANAKAQDCPMIDAPVSGGTKGATEGSLTFIVGGDDNALASARPYLEVMGKNIFHAGDSGAGQVAKICNNMLLAVHMIGTAEALNLGVANGLDPSVLSNIMVKSSGRNWSLELYNPFPGVMEGAPASKDYQGGFGAALMAKDLGLAAEAANAGRVATPMGALARNLYQMYSQTDGGRLDFSSIIRFLGQV